MDFEADLWDKDNRSSMVSAFAIGRHDVDSPSSPMGLKLQRSLSDLQSPVMLATLCVLAAVACVFVHT